jgi:hypothetical protein
MFYYLDPEDYTKYRKVVVAVDFPHQESADAVRLRTCSTILYPSFAYRD